MKSWRTSSWPSTPGMETRATPSRSVDHAQQAGPRRRLARLRVSTSRVRCQGPVEEEGATEHNLVSPTSEFTVNSAEPPKELQTASTNRSLQSANFHLPRDADARRLRPQLVAFTDAAAVCEHAPLEHATEEAAWRWRPRVPTARRHVHVRCACDRRGHTQSKLNSNSPCDRDREFF